MAKAALTATELQFLDGEVGGALGGLHSRNLGLGTRLNELAVLQTNDGAAQIGVLDTLGLFSSTKLEGVLAELAGAGGSIVDLIFTAAGRLAIVGGTVTATQASHKIDGQGDAADDLNSILGGTAEELIFIRADDAAGAPITVKHAIGADLIACPDGLDFVLAAANDFAMLMHDGTQWSVIARSLLAGFPEIVVQAAQLAALGAENTDGEMEIPLQGIADGGTFTPSVTSGGLVSVTRSAADTTESFWVPIPAPNRTGAGKGIKPTGLTVNYEVGTADSDDVRFEVWKVTKGADGAAPTAAVLFGDADGDYDANHNTAGKRSDSTGAPELHRADVLDAGAPAYLAADESLLLRIYVDGSATSVEVIHSASLLYSELVADLA